MSPAERDLGEVGPLSGDEARLRLFASLLVGLIFDLSHLRLALTSLHLIGSYFSSGIIIFDLTRPNFINYTTGHAKLKAAQLN